MDTGTVPTALRCLGHGVALAVAQSPPAQPGQTCMKYETAERTENSYWNYPLAMYSTYIGFETTKCDTNRPHSKCVCACAKFLIVILHVQYRSLVKKMWRAGNVTRQIDHAREQLLYSPKHRKAAIEQDSHTQRLSVIGASFHGKPINYRSDRQTKSFSLKFRFTSDMHAN